MQEFILVLALLTTESSYKSEIERPATAVVDTAQFWFGAESPWRIRTYAIDHDIHIYSLGSRADGTSFTQKEATTHIAKHYGEVLKKHYVITFKNPTDSDGQKYKTQSAPK